MNHAMIDVEALRLKKQWRAPLMEVGVVVFDDIGNVNQSKRILVKKEGLPRWASVEKTTLDWWRDQPYWEKLQHDIRRQGIEARNAITELKDFLQINQVEVVWFAGPQYDQVMLEAYFDDFGIDYPWRYNDTRDLRTIRKQHPAIYDPLVKARNGSHEAVEDCLFQVSILRAISKATNHRWL
jgi:3' exoribonuclease, RNase T-like